MLGNPLLRIIVNGDNVKSDCWNKFWSHRLSPCQLCLGWGLKTKSWRIDSAIAKFISFGHTFAMKIIFSPQKRFSSPWVFVWKPENPHYGVKNKSCRKLHIWVSKPIRRKIQNQWKKLELNRAYQLREKSKKPPKNKGFQKSDISGGILDFSLKW